MIVYVVSSVSIFSTIAIVGIYEDEIDAMRVANADVMMKVTPIEVIGRMNDSSSSSSVQEQKDVLSENGVYQDIQIKPGEPRKVP